MLPEHTSPSFLQYLAGLPPPENVLEKINPDLSERVKKYLINAEAVQVHGDKVLGEGDYSFGPSTIECQIPFSNAI